MISDPVKFKLAIFDLFNLEYRDTFVVFKTSSVTFLRSLVVIAELGRDPEQIPEIDGNATICKLLEEVLI